MNDLTTIPTGWTPRSWAWNLARLGHGCIDEQRGAELRAAAASIAQKYGEPRICADCQLELPGPAVGRPFDRGKPVEDSGDVKLICSVCAWYRERAPMKRRACA